MADMNGGLIAGRVVDGKRRPVADARVRLNFITCETELNGGSLPVQGAGGGMLGNVDTDSKGLFRFFFQWRVLDLPYVMNLRKQGSLIATNGIRSTNHRFLVVLALDIRRVLSNALPIFQDPAADGLQISAVFLTAARTAGKGVVPPVFSTFPPEMFGLVGDAGDVMLPM